jgi:arylsulfatase
VRQPLLAAATAVCLAACGPPPQKARSLLLIVIDTLRRDHLPIYGYSRNTAPELARLAAEGAVFDGLSTSSWTKPSVASILTGLHPLRHQAVLADALPESALTLAEALDAQGFHTLAITSNAHISPSFGFGQGFDEFDSLMKEFDSGALPRPRDLSRALLDRIEAIRHPFFLYLHYLDPHAPYEPDTTWDGRPLPDRLRSRSPLKGVDMQHRRFLERDPGFLQDAVDLYDGEIRGVDADIGFVLGELRARGLLDGTLTVVTADHGEEFEEHGRMGHGKALYGEGVRVPLLFHGPGVTPGLRGGRASVMDILPTSLELLGLAGEGTDGVSHAAALRDGRPPSDAQREFLLFLDLREVGRMGSLALEQGDDKLVLSRFPHAKQLFDVSADPGELRDRFDDPTRAGTRGRLAASLARRYDELIAGALPRAEVAVDDSVARALEALGYVAHVGDAPAFDRPLPESVRPTDPDPRGLLGWEPTAPEAACLETAAPEAVGRLLAGWMGVEHGGRWTEPLATVALARPAGGTAALELRGINPQRDPQRVRVTVGTSVRDLELPPGRFAARAEIGGPGAGENPLKVRVERLPPLIPGRVTPDGREGLGVFLTGLCLVG